MDRTVKNAYDGDMARPRNFDDTAILRAAREQFSATGYAGTSVGDVMAATGLGKGSLYGAFGDKRELFLRVFDDYCAESLLGLRDALDVPEAEAYQRLREHVHAVA